MLLDKLKENIMNNRIVRLIIKLSYKEYIMPIIAFFSLYFFYQLGYDFLYGFYFGGDGNISIFNIFINPVPFNFKSIIGVGVLLIIYCSVLCMPFIGTLFKKFNIYAFMCLLCISLPIMLSIEYMFLGGVNINELGLPAVTLGIPIFICYIVYAIVSFQTYGKSTVLSLFYYLTLLIILNAFYHSILCNQKSIIILLTYFYAFVIIPQINKKIAKYNLERKRILVKWIGSALFAILILSYVNIHDKGIMLFILIYLCMLIYIKGVRDNITNKIMRYKSKSKEEKINNTKYKKIGSVFAVIIFVIFIYPVVSIAVIFYGSSIGNAVMKNYSPNQISYEFNKDNKSSDEIHGTIVAQDGDTYYISQLPERKLAIIKSKSIIVE